MCNVLMVSGAVVDVVANQESRNFPTLVYIFHKNRVFDVLKMCHVIVLDLVSYDYAYPTPRPHVVSGVDQTL